LSSNRDGGDEGIFGGDLPFPIDGYLTEIDTGVIDTDYMNSSFEKYLKDLKKKDVDSEEFQKTLNELHKSFSSLSQEEQKYANIFLHDVQSGNVIIETGKTFKDYISEYQFKAKKAEVNKIVKIFGLDKSKLEKIMETNVTKENIDDYGRLNDLNSTIDKNKAKEYFEHSAGKQLTPKDIRIKAETLLKNFIITGGFEV